MATKLNEVSQTPPEAGTELPKWLQDPLFRGGNNIVNNRWFALDITPTVFYARISELRALQVDEKTREKLIKPFKDALVDELKNDQDGLPVFTAEDILQIADSGLLPEINAKEFKKVTDTLNTLKESTTRQGGTFRSYLVLAADNTLSIHQDNRHIKYGVDAFYKTLVKRNIFVGNSGLVANYSIKINGDYPHADAVEKAMDKFQIEKSRETDKKENAEMKRKIAELEGKNAGKPGAPTLTAKQKVAAEKFAAEKVAADEKAAKETAAAAAKLKKQTDEKKEPGVVSRSADISSSKTELDAASSEYITQKKAIIDAKLKSLVTKKVISQEVATAILASNATSVEAIKTLQKALKMTQDGKFTKELLIVMIDKANS
jgi:hypothetical protein